MISILDTSALVCFVKREKGWEKVLNLLQSETKMSSVNLAEFYAWGERQGQNVDLLAELVTELEIDCVDFDNQQAALSGKIYQTIQKLGLSLGDRACLALSKQLQARVYTCDRVWEGLKNNFGVEILR